MNSNLKIFTWNCPGCASRNFIRIFREYNVEHHPNIVCLLEPRVGGFNFSHLVETVGFSSGIWVGWKDLVRTQILKNHPHPNTSKQKLLWDGLKSAMPSQLIPWFLMGDFNAILSPEDKRSPCTVGKRCGLFGNFGGGTCVKLDLALANDAWMTSFPQCLVTHLPRIKFDHRPLLLSARLDLNLAKGRPLRFLAGWTKHNNFSTFVKERWNFEGNMANSLITFTSYFKDWNKDVYRFLSSYKRQLMRALNNTQKALDRSNLIFLARKEMDIQDELENRQKARCDWLHLGDRNTKFFHSRTIKRRKFNRIIGLRISNGEWCYNHEVLQTEVVGFFEKLYGEVPQTLGDLPNINYSRLTATEISFLEEVITNEEIKRALFDMVPLKAPGSDGFHALFFQSQWNILGNDLNNTLIVLIPKKECPDDFSQFRPISLCSILYKLVMKVIANRFKLVFPNLISQEQAGFIAGRNISDNIILAQEKFKPLEESIRGVLYHLIFLCCAWIGYGTSLGQILILEGGNLFSFQEQEVQNLGKYLGVPLLHNRVTKSTLSFVIDKFIWGSDNGHPKISLVGWDSIFQPGSLGGLGFLHLSDQNMSFLMKIGFGLVSKSNVLWFRVLWAKYGWKEQIRGSINRSQCSHLWRSLAKIWPIL
ncbi:reverse transcriptase [Gossypium australe]|uniref:Reverse transcriptase n=1 Tax=Gossypium australe TaxID=47621 RepID=A0A5B6UWP6_9ROSI|nr:reverse transcriptase [Gossypium australe]